MTFGVSRAMPNVLELPQNDQHTPAVLLKTMDRGTKSIPGIVSCGVATAPMFKEVQP
jgi:hypothetical protein